jgi:cysteinyl-tRNA synthetase
MNDDFNTPDALAVLFDLATEVNKTRLPRDIALMKALGGVLGLLQQDPRQYFQQAGCTEDSAFAPEKVEQLIQQRLVARANKDYREADRIRQELMEANIILEDGPHGTTWRRATSLSTL